MTYPTIRQRVATEKIVQGMSVSKAMREAGYDETSAKNPKNLTESKGFKQLCRDNGLTESLILKALVQDINSKPQDRVKELTLAILILGLGKSDGKRDTTMFISVSKESVGRMGVYGSN